MIKHENKSGDCQKCEQIFNKYPGFDAGLKFWFKRLQKSHPEAHISEAGRGQADQEAAFSRGASRAHYTQSAHNWNSALDIFCLSFGYPTWEKGWFDAVVKPSLVPSLEWYGMPGSAFFELPHVQCRDWKTRKDLKLVEPALVG